MFKFITQPISGGIKIIPPWISITDIGQHAFGGLVIEHRTARTVLLERSQNRQSCFIIRAKSKGRSNINAVVFHGWHLRIAIAEQACQTVGKAFIGRQRPPEIKIALITAVITNLKLDFVNALAGRPFGNEINQPPNA